MPHILVIDAALGPQYTLSMGSPETGDVALDRLRTVLETALDAVVAMRPDGTVAEWNTVAERTFGWTREEAVGRLMADLIVPPQHRAPHIEGVRRFNATRQSHVLGTRLEITAVNRDQREFPVELSITETDVEGRRLFIGFIRDIEDRKQAEQQLVRQARQAELLFHLSRFAAESGAVEPVLQEALRAICEVTQWPVGHAWLVMPDKPDEVVTSDIWCGHSEEGFDRLREVTRACRFTAGVGLPGIILQSGEPAWMSDTEADQVFLRKGLGFRAAFGFPLRSGGRTTAIMEFFARDTIPRDPDLLRTVRTLGEQVGRVLERNAALTQLRAMNENLEARILARSRELEIAQETLRQAQKLEAIGKLTGGIAHDFNNLLTVIRGSIDLLRRSDLGDERRRHYMDAIADTADRAARLTSQLLAFARRQALKPELFDAAERIVAISDMMRTMLGPRINLIVDAGCQGSFIEADVAQFESAVVNLAINARDAMDGKGNLTIQVRTESRDDAQIVAISVSDDGKGIPPDLLTQIFEPFFTTKEVGKGTGLGLSQVYGFVKQSHGDISVKSDLGIGTTFTLAFTRIDADRLPSRVEKPEVSATSRFSKILVVEDNVVVGQAAAEILTDLGFETTLVTSALQALEKIDDTDCAYDLLFTDVVMPDMDGVELAQRVRERCPRLAVLLTSGYSEGLASGAGHGFPLLHKPYSADALAGALQQAFDRHKV